MYGTESLISLQQNFIGDIIAILLVVMLIVVNYGRQNIRKTEYRMVMQLLVYVGLYSIVEIVSCLFDGMPGTWITVLLYILNSALFLIIMLLEICWIKFVAMHLDYAIPKIVHIIMSCVILAGAALLIINPFCPIVFSLNNNIYAQDGPIHFIYWLIAGISFAYTIVMYYICRRRGGVLKYFPVWTYVIPSLVGMILESVLGSYMISAGNAIAIGAILAGMQNEAIFRDGLTGLYNHAYLEEVKIKLEKAKNPFVSGIMLDLDGFKGINDNFGHAEGDKALITVAGLLRKEVGSYGDVIRYAGDEFVIILNTQEKEKLENCTQRIRNAFQNYNDRKEKPYCLSASMGYANFNAETQTVNEFLNMIDKNMYVNKNLHYKEIENNKREQKRT